MMPSAPPPVVLASASPRRRELLAALGVSFEVAPSELDEAVTDADLGAGPAYVAEVLALRKAHAVAPGYPDAVVIGSDTVVALDGQLLGKPADAAEARAMLIALRGRTHEVITGVAVVVGERELVAHERTLVQIRAYTGEEIEAFIATGSPFDKAGGYAIQDEAFAPVESFDGCRCSVVGLPVSLLSMLLLAHGVNTDPARVDCPVCNPLGLS